ncbi:MAG: DNA polymerase III subunit delta [Oscillospiraceae bacterium]|nr:DNA polymerase III subunit delta [Oscillospiraceae bacterium]
MPSISEQSLIDQIKQGDFLPCYLFYGEEQQLIKSRTNQIVSRILPKQARGFNLNRFSTENISIDDVWDIILTIPVLSEKRVVVLDGLAVDKLIKADVEKLKKLVVSIPQSAVLIILVTDKNITPKNCSKLKQLITACSKIGGTLEFPLRTAGDLAKVLEQYAKKRGSDISKNAAYFLIERCGREIKGLIVQLDKLCSYACGREIVKEDIILLTKPNIEKSVFDMTKLILRGNKKEAIIVLNDLIDSQIEPLAILGAINMCFIDLYRAKCAQMAGEDYRAITEFYDYKGKEFRIKNALRDSFRYSILDLRKCIDELCDVDIKCKTTNLDKQILIEKAIFLMMQGDAR